MSVIGYIAFAVALVAYVVGFVSMSFGVILMATILLVGGFICCSLDNVEEKLERIAERTEALPRTNQTSESVADHVLDQLRQEGLIQPGKEVDESEFNNIVGDTILDEGNEEEEK